jgi:hypothetical protein
MTAVNPQQLWDELTAAGVIVPGISTPDGTLESVHTFEDGFPAPLPEAAAPIVAAHVAEPPITHFSKTITTSAKVRTSGATSTELLRAALKPLTGYDVNIRLLGVDGGNGAVKKLVVDFTVKRLNAGPVQVGNTTVLVNHTDTAAATWTAGFTFDGNDIVIMVTGAANRTIDWGMVANINSFTPGGDSA